MHAIVTPIAAGILGLIYVYLSLRVSRLRILHRIGMGHGEKPELQRAIRAHANFVEYVPLSLILLLAAQLLNAHVILLSAAAAALVIGRVLHAIGLSLHGGASWPRQVGIILTYLVIAVMSVACIVYALLTLRAVN